MLLGLHSVKKKLDTAFCETNPYTVHSQLTIEVIHARCNWVLETFVSLFAGYYYYYGCKRIFVAIK